MINLGRFRVWYAKSSPLTRWPSGRQLSKGFEPLEKRNLLSAFVIAASASSSSVQVGDTVQFNAHVLEGGSAPYTYEWKFDDVESYKTPTTSQNASHTFDYPGRHYVEVEVTDGASHQESVSLIVDVAIDTAMLVANAVTDIGLDNTGEVDCGATLETYIANNNDVDHGLRIEFPSGTYRFDDRFGANTTYAIGINGASYGSPQIKKIAFVGIGSQQPTLVFHDDSDAEGHHAFFHLHGVNADPGFNTYVLVSNLQIEMEHDPDLYAHNPEFFYGGDIYARQEYQVIEDSTLRNFGRIGNHSRTIHKRNNIVHSGDFANDVGATELIRYAQDGLSIRNYIGNLDEDHSHAWYFTGADNTYIVDNYADLSNGHDACAGAQLKNAMHDSTVVGNMIKNADGTAIALGKYRFESYNLDVLDNRIIGTEQAVAIYASSHDVRINDNFFSSIERHVLAAGNQGGENAFPVLGVTLQDNVVGYDAGGEVVHNVFEEYGVPLEFDVTESGTINNSQRYVSSDPSGWYDASGYVDPGSYEYKAPTVNSFQINGGSSTTNSRTVTLNMNVADSGSGMGAAARFPYKKGALMQFSNDGSNWHQVELYSATHTWTLPEGSGTQTVYARFRDADGNWTSTVNDSIEFSSLPENQDPTATNDSVTTDEDSPVSVNVVVNDFDDDGTIDAGTVTVVAAPAHGTAVCDPSGDGTITYTPYTGYSGTDTFCYTVQDSEGATSNEASVTVSVASTGGTVDPDDPTASGPHLKAGSRQVFYNNSTWDGNDASPGAADDGAVASDKQALLPGGTATFANYTSYSLGINGIMVDVAEMQGTPTSADFEFKVGNSDSPSDWDDAPEPTSITVRPGEGADGSDRVTLIWPDGAIRKQWLQVTVLPGGNIGLAQPDVFYFGNAVGESGNSVVDAKVNAFDVLRARDNQRNFINPAPLDFPFDFDRDRNVNVVDVLIARNNTTHFVDALRLTAAPLRMTASSKEESSCADVSAEALDWLHEVETTNAERDGLGKLDLQPPLTEIDSLLAERR